LPKKLDVGEQFSVYFIADHQSLAKGDYQRIGFDDTFGSLHWPPRRHILDALPAIRAACETVGKDWREIVDCPTVFAALQWRMPAVTRPQKITFAEMNAIHIASALVAEQDDKRVRN